MNTLYFTVGPSQLYPTVGQHVQDALAADILSASHTGSFFVDTYKHLSDNLRKLYDIPETHRILFTASSTESMQTVIMSCVEHTSAHLITGGFSEKFYKTAVDLNKSAIKIVQPWHDSVDFDAISLPPDTELLCITENDTSIGMQLPLDNLGHLKAKNDQLLIAVDIVSSMPYSQLDYSVVDMAFFSVHKGLGLPAGLGVLIASDHAIQKSQKLRSQGHSIGSHNSLVSLAEKADSYKTPATPNVLNIYLLDKVVSDLYEIGLPLVRQQTEAKAKLIYDYFDAQPNYKPLMLPQYRSQTTIVIDVHGDALLIAQKLVDRGFHVSKGYRPHELDHIRIANFPAHTYAHVQSLLAAMDEIL